MDEIAILLLRLVVGFTLVAHGFPKFKKRKVLDHKWKHEYGLPVGSVVLTAISQVTGGLAIMAGIFTPIASVLLALNLLVATWVSIWKHHEPFLSLPEGKGWDVNLLLVGALIVLALLGDGSLSLAALIR